METLKELIKIIEDNLEEDWVKIKGAPKRCVLKGTYSLGDVPGYFVTFYYPDYEGEEFLFISDVKNKHEFHNAPSLFETKCFEHRCKWVWTDDVECEEFKGFFI